MYISDGSPKIFLIALGGIPKKYSLPSASQIAGELPLEKMIRGTKKNIKQNKFLDPVQNFV